MRRLARLAAALAAFVAAVLALAVAAGAGGAPSGLPLREIGRMPLPGPAVRFDYTALDPSTGLLWIAHMNASELLAVDVKKRRVVHAIPAPRVHGVIAVPALGRVFASATDARQAWTIDARSGKVLARADAGRYPDGLAWDAKTRRVFVSDESGGVETVLDAKGRKIATIDLGGEAGNVQSDPVSGLVLADVQTRNDIAVIDPRRLKVVRRIPVPGCDADHSLLLDAPHRLAFVACEGNARLVVIDLRTEKAVGGDRVGGSPDVLAFDPGIGRGRLYVSAESGDVAVFQETAHGAKRLGLAHLADAAHTVAVDPVTHRVYFPLERGNGGDPQLLVLLPT